MIIKIDAIDTLFFRDGKPFGDEDSWANSNFFPSPSTIYGALRAIYFSQNSKDLNKANTTNDPTKDLTINGIYFYKDKKPFFIIPQDLVKVENKDNLEILTLVKSQYSNTPLESSFYYKGDNNIKKVDGFLTSLIMKGYLKLSKDNFRFINSNKIIFEEYKIGIGRNNKKVAEDSKLYRIGLNRYEDDKFNKFSLVIDFEGLDIGKEGLLRFGGEGKGAYYQKINSLNKPTIDKVEGNIFKLYLLTPAIFKNGWYPDWLDENFKGKFKDIELELIASAIGKPQYIGGWDIDKNQPKKMFKVIPAGSVYYFRVVKGEKEMVREVFDYKSIVSIEDYQKEGFGIAIVGNYKKG